jgi:hypothetical protein
MWIMADEALAVLAGIMKHGGFHGLMALRAQGASSGEQGDGCFVSFGDDLVAVLATYPNCRVDEFAFFLFRMAG